MYIYLYDFLNELQALGLGLKQSLLSFLKLWSMIVKAQLNLFSHLIGAMFNAPVLIKRHSPESYEKLNRSPLDYVESSGLHPPGFNR